MLLKDYKVKKPASNIKIVKRNNDRYVYYIEKYFYDKSKKYSNDKRVLIGKMIDDEYMIPNDKYRSYFPEDESILLEPTNIYADQIKVGINTVINKIFDDTLLAKLLNVYMGDKYKLIMDIVSYMIINETCTYEYFPYYEKEHYTNTHKVYSDSTISNLLTNDISPVNINSFLEAYNASNNNIEDVYVNVDATNINVISDYDGLAQFGKAKDDENLPQINITYVSRLIDNRPLTYELYHGSVNDSNEFKFLLRNFEKYGYKNISFIMDRIYYSKDLMIKLIKNNYGFLCMLKGNYDFIDEPLNKNRIKLLNKLTCYISEYELSGISEEIYLDDKKKIKAYLHLYFNETKAVNEKNLILKKVEDEEEYLNDLINVQHADITPDSLNSYSNYFSFKTNPETKTVISYKRKDDEILKDLNDCGFFFILSSKNISAKEVISTYRERDSIEKLFRALKSSLEFDHVGVHTRKALESKVFLTFIASIVRNEIFQKAKKLDTKDKKTFTVPRIIKELDDISALNITNNIYARRYALTKNQRKLLSLFDLKEKDIDETINNINTNLKK